MKQYEVTAKIVYTKTFVVLATDSEDAYNEVENMIDGGDFELDLTEELENYEVLGCCEDIFYDPELSRGCDLYHQLKDEGKL